MLVASDAEDAKSIIKTSKRAFDLPKEVVAFVEHIIDADPEARASYARLIAPVADEAGGRFSVGPFVAIEWLVPEASVDFKSSGGTRDYEGVFLVRRQLRFGIHRGYSIPDNVVARVSVVEHQNLKANPRKDDDFILTSTTLTLHFDGFVNVQLTPN